MKKVILLTIGTILAACGTLPTSGEWLARADGYFKDGKPQQAIAAYNKAQQLNPKRADIYASRGATYFFMGEYKLAEQDFLQVLEINPYQAEAFNALASALAAQGDYQNALTAVNAAVALQPNRTETFFTRGGINFMLAEYEQAVRDYTVVLQQRPAADVYHARAAAYLKLGKKEAAEKDFEAAKGPIPAQLTEYRMID